MNATQELTDSPITPELLRGAIEFEQTPRGLIPHRLPAWARAQGADGQLLMAEAQPSGQRLVFRTAATVLELDTVPVKRVSPGTPPRPDGIYELFVDGRLAGSASADGGDILSIDIATGATEVTTGESVTLRFDGLPAGMKDVELWLPHNESAVLAALRADAPIEQSPRNGRRVWLHHGSSISQGSGARVPTGTWVAVAARQADVDLINLGFGGSAMLDPFVARTIRDTPADLISIKLGINLVNADLLRRRAFTPAVHGFLDTIRDGHPDTPLLVASPLYCPIHEDTPGPTDFDREALAEGRLKFRATGDPLERAEGKLSLNLIRKDLEAIVRQRSAEDQNLHYLDGRDLYSKDDYAELPMEDDLHPDAPAHLRIGERFAAFAVGSWALRA